MIDSALSWVILAGLVLTLFVYVLCRVANEKAQREEESRRFWSTYGGGTDDHI